MASPKEIVAQLLSPAQAELLASAGGAIRQSVLGALGQFLGASPSLGAMDGRLVMPEEILGEYEEPHLVLPLQLSTARDQSATAYATAPTGAIATFFGADEGPAEEQAAQASLVGATIIGQVMAALARDILAGSPAGLRIAAGEMAADAMPTLLAAMDEPALVIDLSVDNGAPAPIALILPGSFLDVLAGALPPQAAAPPPPATSPFEITLDELEAAELVHDAGPNATSPADVPHDPLPFRQPLPQQPPAAPTPTAHRARFTPLPDPEPAAQRSNLDLLAGLQMHVSVELGRTDLTVAEVLGLGPGSVVELDRVAGEPVDILVNDRLIARGEVVVVDENFGVRVVEVVRRGAEHEERAS